MQDSILFIGDSHAHGYWYDTEINDLRFWDINNYAQIYANDIASSKCYVYSYPGAPNNKYPRWIKHMLNIHPDISAVLLQSTYWDRWIMANNIRLDFPELDVGHFTRKFYSDDNVILYDDYNTIEHIYLEWNEKPKWGSISKYNESVPDLNGLLNWPGYNSKYMHIKFHDEILTHLTYEMYSRDIALIDTICAEKNIPVYIWRMTDRVEFPEKFDSFKKLTNTKIFRTPANIWIKENLNIDIDSKKVDEEHYNYESHKLVAHHFIPELINASRPA